MLTNPGCCLHERVYDLTTIVGRNANGSTTNLRQENLDEQKGVPVAVEIDIKGRSLREALLSINSTVQDEVFADGGNSEQVRIGSA